MIGSLSPRRQETEIISLGPQQLVKDVIYGGRLQVSEDQWDSEKKGMWFYGCTDKTDGNKVFLPAAGKQYCDYGEFTTYGRGVSGEYWTSSNGGIL